MNYLKEQLKKHRQFYKVLSIAIAVNLFMIGALAFFVINVKEVTLTVDGESAQFRTMKSSVDELLASWDVKLDKKDVVAPGKKAEITEGMDINIKRYDVKTKVVSEATDFKKSSYFTSDLLEGETKVTQKGKKGEDKVTYEITYLGKKETGRKEIARETVKKPVTEKTAKGTAISYNGERYTRKLTVVSTGYTHTGNRTATGTSPHRGTMAVDRSVIPMGSYGYVPGYGTVHAEDTGGAIRGNRIDLFFESRGQAISWGRRTVVIYLK